MSQVFFGNCASEKYSLSLIPTMLICLYDLLQKLSLHSSPFCLEESGVLCWPMCFPAYFRPCSFWCDFCCQGFCLCWGFLPCTPTWAETTDSFSLLACSPERQWLLTAAKADLTPGIYRWKASREMLRPGSFILYQDVPTLLPLEALVSTELNLIFSLGDKKWWQLITSAQNKQVLRKGPNHTLKYRYIHLHLRTGSWTGSNLNTWLNDSTSEDCSAPNQGMCNFVPLFKWCKTF